MKLVSFASFGQEKIIDELKGSSRNIDVIAQSYMVYLLGFLYFIAVVYGLYGGYLVLTAATDEGDKVKKGRTVIIQACLGIVVIFFAGPIARFFIGAEGILTK